jgi:hypothetical protein
MSTLGGGNGDGWPPDGGGQSDGLPGLPPEWGTVVIPDDPAELADEAAEVRRELRREARRTTWRRRFGLPPKAPGEQGQPSLGLPLLIMSIAVIATLTSLFAVAWPGRNNHPALNPAASRDSTYATPASVVPDLALTDDAGTPVRLKDAAPEALLLVDGCDCVELVTATLAAAPGSVDVLLVGRTAPTIGPSTVNLRRLADPGDQLRGTLGLGPPGKLAAVVLVAQGGEVVRKMSAVAKVDAFRADLAKLS